MGFQAEVRGVWGLRIEVGVKGAKLIVVAGMAVAPRLQVQSADKCLKEALGGRLESLGPNYKALSRGELRP